MEKKNKELVWVYKWKEKKRKLKNYTFKLPSYPYINFYYVYNLDGIIGFIKDDFMLFHFSSKFIYFWAKKVWQKKGLDFSSISFLFCPF